MILKQAEQYAWRLAANWRNSLDPEGDPSEMLTVYHRTTRPFANKIVQNQSFTPNAERADSHIYFSMRPGGDSTYGPSVVSTQVPRGVIKRDESHFWGGGPNDPQWVKVHSDDLVGRPIRRERSR